MVLKRFGDLQPGDVIRGTDGREVTVVEAYDEHIPDRMFEVEMDDGVIIKASGNHLWYIETEVDYAMHRERRKQGKKILKFISQEVENKLLDVAEHGTQDIVETSLIDMFTLLSTNDDQDYKSNLLSLLERVAESLGPISETNIKYHDYLTDDEIEEYGNTVKHYDAVLFAQQLLSLKGERKYMKRWNLITGKVVTTEDMLSISENIEIPVVQYK